MASPGELSNPVAPRAAKQQRLLAALRSRIVEGQFGPGERLPTRVELLEEYNVSTLTLQKALDRLIVEGFLVTRGRAGTFVTDRPPHLHHFALVFPHRDTEGTPWPRFWTALASEAQRISQRGRQRLAIHYSMYGHRDTREYRELRQAVRSHLFAGLLFCSPPRDLLDSSIVREGPAARVSIGHAGDPDIAVIQLESTGFIDKALDHLRARGRRRIAMITATTVHTSEHEQAHLRRAVEARGLTLHPWWVQALDATRPQWAYPCAQLLMQADRPERPDGLIIANDNLVESASGGLVAAGVRVPDDVDVVAHCNFPWPTPSVLPIERLGYDARDVLGAFIDIASTARADPADGPTVRTIAARFEKELDEPRGAARL